MRGLLLLLAFIGIACAQFYDISLVRASDSMVQSMVYDDASASYKDNSLENPDILLRICSEGGADLMGKWVTLAYADGYDGDYIILEPAPQQVDAVDPSGCAYQDIHIQSFYAWYPSIPYVFIADDSSLAGAERWKLSRLRGWFEGSYSAITNQVGSSVNVTIDDALDDLSVSIVPDVDYLVVGLVRPDYTTMDTVITSPDENDTLLSDGGAYALFINGIGPDLPPYVEILTPEPTTYDTGSIPFTYIMYDDDDIAACWYILDGVNYTIPVCGVAYILDVGAGSHSLTLYGLDTTGNVGSDSVSFTVGAVSPPPGGGGGGTQTPYYQPKPAPPPPGLYFSIIPGSVTVVIDYPLSGEGDFTVTANTDIYGLSCYVDGDFAMYSTVVMESDFIPANGTVDGTLTVDMSPLEMFEYSRGMNGTIQCIGKTNPTLVSSTVANVYLIINRPVLAFENTSIDMLPGQTLSFTADMTNVGPGNATAINITLPISNYPYILGITDYPSKLMNGEKGTISFVIHATEDTVPGTYIIRIEMEEWGRRVGIGQIAVRILEGPAPGEVCRTPDLEWTIIILLIGMGAAIYIFRKKLMESEGYG